MGTDKRERQKAARSAKREKELAAVKRAKMLKSAKRAAIIIAVIAVILIVLNVTAADDASAKKPITTTAPVAATTAANDDEAAAPADEAATTDNEPAVFDEAAFDPIDPDCPATDGSGPIQKQFTGEPPTCIDADTTYTAVFDTTAGEIAIALDQSVDMASVNNFIFLARHRYYEGVTFHRVIEDFMVQGGDPIGQPRGTGGPGYAFTGEQPDITSYPLGAFAMANTGNPSSNGSQFFIVTGPNGQALPNSYSLMGVVTDGLDVAVAISKVETAPGDAPLVDVTINSIQIIES